MKRRRNDLFIHAALICFAALTLLPFVFVINNSLRSSTEMDYSFFGFPDAIKKMADFTADHLRDKPDRIKLRIAQDKEEKEGRAANVPLRKISYHDAMAHLWNDMTLAYRYAWSVLRVYILNTILVCAATVLGVIAAGSLTAYVFSRYRFPGHKFLFLVILSFMMIPGILTLVPSFLLVKELGLLNSYWVLILPYVAGGQIIAIFLFKGFFDGLPNELFESARLDGAGHFQQYWHIVLPLSKQIISVVAIINILGVWNNFLWPFITNSDDRYHVIASGLFVMASSEVSQNRSVMFAAYTLSAIPLLILFIYATKPFMAGVTSGAFKA